MRRRVARVEANLTPMIDVTFLLIVFFVLVSQIVETESVPMQLPEPSNPLSELAGDEQRAVINVMPDSDTGIRGYRLGSREYASGEQGLRSLTAQLRSLYGGNPTLQVNLRADQRTAYQHVQPVIAAVADAAATAPNGPADARLNIVIVVDES